MAQGGTHPKGNAGQLVGGQGEGEGQAEQDQQGQLHQAGAATRQGGQGVGHKSAAKQSELKERFSQGHG